MKLPIIWEQGPLELEGHSGLWSDTLLRLVASSIRTHRAEAREQPRQVAAGSGNGAGFGVVQSGGSHSCRIRASFDLRKRTCDP